MVRTQDSSYYLTGALQNEVTESESGLYVKFRDGEIWSKPNSEVRMGPLSWKTKGASIYTGLLGVSVHEAISTANCTYVASEKLSEEELELFKTKIVSGFKVGPYRVKDFYKPGQKFRKRVNRLAGVKPPRWHE